MKNYDEAKLYNPGLKSEYLEQYDSDDDKKTQTTIAYKFYRTKESEEYYGKDLAEFTEDQLQEIFRAMKPMNENVAKTNGRFIKNYISWAIPKLNIMSNINPLSKYTSDWYTQFVDKDKILYLSEDEIIEMVEGGDALKNAADAIIPLLIFNGVSGHEVSEILNLQGEVDSQEGDIDWDNGILHLKDDRFGERDLELFDDLKEVTLRTLRQALKETEYQNKNGQSEGRNQISKLVQNNFVIKTVDRRNKSDGKADRHLIYRRISTIADYYQLPYLTVKNIEKSGMLKMAKDLYLSDGELDRDQIIKIGDQFGKRKINVNGYEYYNKSLLSEFINAKNIKKLYNVDIKSSNS